MAGTLHETKKFLDQTGLIHILEKLNNYPTNDLLSAVVDGVQDALNDKADLIFHNTEAAWATIMQIPADGQILIYDADEDHPSPRLKIGDGEHNASELPFVGGSGGSLPDSLFIDSSGNAVLTGNFTARGGQITVGHTTMTESNLQSLLSTTSAEGVSF